MFMIIMAIIRLICSYKINDKEIDNINKKNSRQCSKCWAKHFCRDCIADVLLKNKEPDYNKRVCVKKQLYNYALFSLINLYDKDKNLFNKFIENFYKNYLF